MKINIFIVRNKYNLFKQLINTITIQNQDIFYKNKLLEC